MVLQVNTEGEADGVIETWGLVLILPSDALLIVRSVGSSNRVPARPWGAMVFTRP